MDIEHWAFVISVISLLISFGTLYQDKKLNSINLQSDYYKKVFEDYLLKEIPIAVSLIAFRADGKLDKDYKELNRILLKMLEDCTYFAYANNGFYEKLRKTVVQIDDKLVETAGTVITDLNKQVSFIYSIHQDMQSMVKLINKYYMA